MTTVDLPSGAALSEWEGWCLELVDHLLHQHPSGQVLYVEEPCAEWTYHVALVLDGLVYDAWHPEARLPPAEYVAAVFGEVEWEIIAADAA